MVQGYMCIQLPLEIVDSIDKAVKKRADLGYRSRPDYILAAVRPMLEKDLGEKL